MDEMNEYDRELRNCAGDDPDIVNEYCPKCGAGHGVPKDKVTPITCRRCGEEFKIHKQKWIESSSPSGL